MVCRSNGGVHRGEVRYRVPATLGMVQIGCVNIHVSVGFHLEMSLLKNPIPPKCASGCLPLFRSCNMFVGAPRAHGAMSNATCQVEGACECFWRYGLTGDACDQWTTRAAWHITGRTLSLTIFLAAGLHTALVLTKTTIYQCRSTRSILGACAPLRIICSCFYIPLWSALSASAFGCAHFSFSLAVALSNVEIPIHKESAVRMLRVTEGEVLPYCRVALTLLAPNAHPQP